MFRRLDDSISVFGQLPPQAMRQAADAGFAVVVNNRPDDEEAGQPGGAASGAEAEAAGLAFYALPVTHAGFDEWQVAAMAKILAEAPGPVLAFCRSGTRSTLLWALARARLGDDAATLAQKAAAAGYDLSPIRPLLG